MRLSPLRALAAAWIAAWALIAAPAARAEAPACPPVAQPIDFDDAQMPSAPQPDRGFLWRLRKDGRTSWLYGTIHIAKLDWAFIGNRTFDAVRASDLVAVELDLTDRKLLARIVELMKPRPDHTLDDATNKRLLAQVKAACLPESLMGAMSPEWVSVTLSALVSRHDGLDPAYAIDRSVALAARHLGKPVLSLETPELQASALQASTADEARERVKDTMEALEGDQVRPLMRRVALVWADSRYPELERYAEWCRCMDTERERVLMRRLLNDRNPAMAERIDALHAGGKQVFAAVGSLHMVGPAGLPALFRARGYEVEQVDFR